MPLKRLLVRRGMTTSVHQRRTVTINVLRLAIMDSSHRVWTIHRSNSSRVRTLHNPRTTVRRRRRADTARRRRRVLIHRAPANRTLR
jgi:hypothetical protein